MQEEEYISIGKITGVHGLHGNLKVHSYAESIDIFEQGTDVCVRSAAGVETNYIIRGAQPYKKGVLLSFEHISDRTSAEDLVGSDLLISSTHLPELDDDEFYWFEIIGLKVYSEDGGYLGTVRSIIPTGSNDVYVVKKKGSEVLIPALESVILSIDTDAQKMIVDLPEGL